MFRTVADITTMSISTVDSMTSSAVRHHAAISLVCVVLFTHPFVVVASRGSGISLYPDGVGMRVVTVLAVDVPIDRNKSVVVGDEVSYCGLEVSTRLVPIM